MWYECAAGEAYLAAKNYKMVGQFDLNPHSYLLICFGNHSPMSWKGLPDLINLVLYRCQALKKFASVEVHWGTIQDDQIDYHSYCMRKSTLRQARAQRISTGASG